MGTSNAGQTQSGTQGGAFKRGRLTWAAYILLAYYGYLLNVLGPITPYLRAKLNVTYTLASFHFSAFAAGMILAGLFGERLVRRIGRRGSLWLGGVGMAAGAVILGFGAQAWLTIGASFLMGVLGSFLLVLVPSILAGEHGYQAGVAVSEANVLASLLSTLAPIAVGVFASWAGDWRAALFLPVAGFGAIALAFRSVTIPGGTTIDAGESHRGRLPPAYWMTWLTLVLAVSMEFCMIFWCADYLEREIGLPRATAATAVSLFLIAMMAGRWAGSRLVRRIPARRVVAGALLLAGFGFVIFWRAPGANQALLGLLLTGLGIANLYPLILTQALHIAGGEADLASTRATLASGTAILLLPLLLGGIADDIGLRSAYGIVAVLILLACVTFWLAGKLAARKIATA
jgi:fucose permease